MRCATGTSGPLAQTKRTSTRKPSAHQRAHHFPKDVRYIRNGAHTILPAAHIILPGRAHHFCQLRKPFCLEAHIILLVVLRRQHRRQGACLRGRVTGSQKAGWWDLGRHGGLSPWSHDGLADSRRSTGTGPRGSGTHGTTNWLPNMVPRGQAPRRHSQLPKRARPVCRFVRKALWGADLQKRPLSFQGGKWTFSLT